MQEYGVCLLKLKQTDKALRIFQGLLASHPTMLALGVGWQPSSWTWDSPRMR